MSKVKTHPVAYGYDSIIMDLEYGRAKAADVILYIVANYCSTWKSGKTKYLSVDGLATMIGISTSYVSKILRRTGRFIQRLKSNRKGTMYEVIKHAFDDSLDDESKLIGTKMFAVPYGVGSPIEAMIRGVISWKACLVWVILKRYSDWTTGVTLPTTMLELAQRCRFGSQTICACIAELTEAGFITRLSGKNEKAIYQLTPTPVNRKGKKGMTPKQNDESQYPTTADHIMSFNWQYRISKVNGKIERRTGYKEWRLATDKELNFDVPYIRNDLQSALFAWNQAQNLRSQLAQI